MIKRFFVLFVKNQTYEMTYGLEIARLVLTQVVFWTYTFFQGRQFGLPLWARILWVPVWIFCWYSTALCTGRLFQIQGNRKAARTVTPDQLQAIREVYPEEPVYLYLDGKYVIVPSKETCSITADATLVRIGKKPLSDRKKLKKILGPKKGEKESAEEQEE